MKSKWQALWFFLLLIEIFSISWVECTEAAKAKSSPGNVVKKQKSCSACHEDFTTVLPQKHPPVKGNVVSICMECHAPKGRGMIEPNKFDARLHLAHLKRPTKADCLDCHTWQPGKSFGLFGTKASYGAPSKKDMALIKDIFTSAVESNYLDARHLSKNITCAACHNKDILGEAAMENKKCLGCHGPLEKLIDTTAPKDFPDRNPHKSHLGEMNCTVCHTVHAESKVYCLECHPKFEMKLK